MTNKDALPMLERYEQRDLSALNAIIIAIAFAVSGWVLLVLLLA